MRNCLFTKKAQAISAAISKRSLRRSRLVCFSPIASLLLTPRSVCAVVAVERIALLFNDYFDAPLFP